MELAVEGQDPPLDAPWQRCPETFQVYAAEKKKTCLWQHLLFHFTQVYHGSQNNLVY